METSDGSLPPGLEPVNVRGARLAYKEVGTGQPLVLVHANISDIRSYDAIVPHLAKYYKVIIYCRRYHWPLEGIPDETPDPWEEQAEDLAALIDVLGISPVTLMGHSSGSTLTLLVARKYPDRVRALILGEPPAITMFLPHLPPSPWDVLKLLIWHPFYFWPLVYFGATVVDPTEKNFKQNNIKAALDSFLRGVIGKEAFEQLSDERWEQVMTNAKPHRALFCYGSFLPSFSEDDARAITAPTLVLDAEKTVPAQKVINTHLTSLIPEAKKVVIDGVSHFMFDEGPEKITAAIVEWGAL